MTQKERDRLVALKKAKKKLITQKQAASEIGVSERQVRRLLRSLKRRGDKAVIHALRGQRSNRKIADVERERAIHTLSQDEYRGFGPTLAAEYLAKKHALKVSRETLRSWMAEAKLWRVKAKRVEKVHTWRPRRSRFGELVQWDTSEHNWLEGRGPKLYLIAMIDDATSRMLARFVEHDSTEENMRLLQTYLERHGRPLSFYTDKASLFVNLPKTRRGEIAGKDAAELPPTQIGRALKELDIEWIAAHSPQAKGRVERGFGTAQDRLVKGLRVAQVKTLKQANPTWRASFYPGGTERLRWRRRWPTMRIAPWAEHIRWLPASARSRRGRWPTITRSASRTSCFRSHAPKSGPVCAAVRCAWKNVWMARWRCASGIAISRWPNVRLARKLFRPSRFGNTCAKAPAARATG